MGIEQGARLVGRFAIGELAGSGGMGAVYRARDLQTGEAVAIKVLRHDERHVARFKREIRVLSELSHPGIVRYVDSGETPEGEPYLVMEWLDGETLEARLAREELSIADALALGRAAAEALGAAHARGVIHRDVKPSNLFLVGGRPQNVKVLDFGIARDMGASTALTRTGGILGTLGYMAPEQAAGEDDIDARADVFALGLVLYRAAAGRDAFASDSPMALLAKLVFEEPPAASSCRPEVPPALDALLARMLAKARDGRPADGEAAAHEIEALGELHSAGARGNEARTAVALTRRERRLASALLMRVVHRPLQAMTTQILGAGYERAALLEALHLRSSELSFLADGALVVIVEATGAATDLAGRAARHALELRARHPGAAIVIATGRVERGTSPSGEVIERASALLQLAERAAEPAILLDDVTAGLVAGRFEVRAAAMGPVLSGEGAPEHARAAGRARAGAIPFRGRDRELARLLDLYEACVEDEQAQVVLVTAPAGAGKSRLAAEMLARLGAEGQRFEILRAQGDPLREASPLAMIASCIRAAAGLREGEPLEVRREKLRAEVHRRLPESSRERVTEFLGELVRTPFPDEGRLSLKQARGHAELLSEEMRRAFEDYLEALCAEGPLLILAEDLHWADAASQRYLHAAMRRLRRRPVLLLALARPELRGPSPRTWDDQALTEIGLGGLRPRAAQEIVRAGLGQGASDEIVARLVERAGGNAFYLEELIRAEAEGHDDTLPDTVLAMVQARLGVLPASARAVLRAASIYGEVFWQGSIQALLGAEAGAADASLPLLLDRDVIVSRVPPRFAGAREFAFRHALLRDGAYALLTDADRRTGHRLAAGWLEGAGERDAMILAAHYEHGGMAERAEQWCLTAAEEAFERDDLDAAEAAARRGLAIRRAAGGAEGEGSGSGLGRVLATIAERRRARGAGTLPAAIAEVPPSSYRFSIATGARVFVEVCAGRWSLDFTRQYVADFKRAAAPLLGGPWGKLCNLDAWLPTEPDAAETIIDFLRWSIDHGMSCVAYVIHNPSARLQARRIIEASSVALMCDFFAAEDEGLGWLRRNGV